MGVLLTSSVGIFLISQLRKAAVISDVKQTLQSSFHSCCDLGTSVQHIWLLAFFLLVRSRSVFQALTVVIALVVVSTPAVFLQKLKRCWLEAVAASSLLGCCD